MKVVLFCGGQGTRLREETEYRPKPLVEIGGRPILWHIMKIYSSHGVNDFIVCLGYKGYIIKEYFSNYFLHMSNVTFDMRENKMKIHQKFVEPWSVTLVDTGEHTMTGGSLKRVQNYIDGETFCLSYGDGVSDIDITNLVNHHKSMNRLATITAIQPPGRYGALMIENDSVHHFQEKPEGDGAWINGGFFVLEPEVFDYIEGDATKWEEYPLEKLAAEGQLSAYKHAGFWQAMDTLRDKRHLEDLWATGNPPWKSW